MAIYLLLSLFILRDIKDYIRYFQLKAIIPTFQQGISTVGYSEVYSFEMHQ